MRLGISAPLQHENPKDWGKKQRELGCKCVVFPVDHTASENVIADYVDAAHANDLVIAEVGIWKNVLSADEKEREENRKYAIRQLQLADDIGAKCCVNIAGTSGGPIWDGGYRWNFSKEAFEETVAYTRQLLDTVKPKNTTYTMESMPWMIPSGPDEYLKLIQEVDRDSFMVHMDLINMITSPQRYFFSNEFCKECFDKLGTLTKSCHIKDIHLAGEYTFRLEETACGKGELDLLYYIDQMEQYDTEMPVIIEHLHTEQEYIDSMNYMKNLIAKKA